jgi:hypothetical protein
MQVANFLVFAVRYTLINFVYRMFPLFFPEMSAGRTSNIVQTDLIQFAWTL